MDSEPQSSLSSVSVDYLRTFPVWLYPDARLAFLSPLPFLSAPDSRVLPGLRAASVSPSLANPLHGRQLPSTTLFLPPRSAHVRVRSAFNLARQSRAHTSRFPTVSGFIASASRGSTDPHDTLRPICKCPALGALRTRSHSPVRLSHVRLPANVTGSVRQTLNQLVRAASSAPSAVFPLVYEYPNAPFCVRSVVSAARQVAFAPHCPRLSALSAVSWSVSPCPSRARLVRDPPSRV